MSGGYSGLLQGVVLASNVLCAESGTIKKNIIRVVLLCDCRHRGSDRGICEFAYETRSDSRITVSGTGPCFVQM